MSIEKNIQPLMCSFIAEKIERINDLNVLLEKMRIAFITFDMIAVGSLADELEEANARLKEANATWKAGIKQIVPTTKLKPKGKFPFWKEATVVLTPSLA